MSITGLSDMSDESNVGGDLTPNNIRKALCKYFVSDVGSLSKKCRKYKLEIPVNINNKLTNLYRYLNII